MRCVWASIDENGKTHGGKAGNQKNELKVGSYYDFGQKYIIRPKETAIAYKIADAAYQLAINKSIGYDQYQRETLAVELEKCGWDPGKLKTLCEGDCSELAVVAINCAYKKKILAFDTYSGNIVDRAYDTGKFSTIRINDKSIIKQGDIIVAPGHHVIIAVGTLQEPAKKTDPAPSWVAGKTYICRVNLNVRTGPGTDRRIKKIKELTADGKKHATNKSANANAILKAGTRVTCKRVIKDGKEVWLQIPSGYICAYNGDKRYVY